MELSQARRRREAVGLVPRQPKGFRNHPLGAHRPFPAPTHTERAVARGKRRRGLVRGSHIAPHEGGAEGAARPVEEDDGAARGVAAQANDLELGSALGLAGGGDRGSARLAQGRPPVVGALFRPPRLDEVGCVGMRGRPELAALEREDDDARRLCAGVNPNDDGSCHPFAKTRGTPTGAHG